jgi:AcrR family transcriptional regulator
MLQSRNKCRKKVNNLTRLVDFRGKCDQPRATTPSQFSAREVELLTVTSQLLREHGYGGLTVDAVAAAARASKATIYRRWPSKAELVLAAFIESVRQTARPPNTGTLREDLLCVGELVYEHVQRHAGTIRAVLSEASRNRQLGEAVQREFVGHTGSLINRVLWQAADRGEIGPTAISDDVGDIFVGYLVFRSVLSGRPPTHHTVRALVDNVVIPSLTQPASRGACP